MDDGKYRAIQRETEPNGTKKTRSGSRGARDSGMDKGSNRKKTYKRRTGERKGKKEWWDKECFETMKELKRRLRKWKRGTMDKEKYLEQRREYKRVCERKKRGGKEQEERVIREIKTEEDVWKYLNKKKKRGDKNNIPIQEWEKHYIELLEGEQGRCWEEGEKEPDNEEGNKLGDEGGNKGVQNRGEDRIRQGEQIKEQATRKIWTTESIKRYREILSQMEQKKQGVEAEVQEIVEWIREATEKKPTKVEREKEKERRNGGTRNVSRTIKEVKKKTKENGKGNDGQRKVPRAKGENTKECVEKKKREERKRKNGNKKNKNRGRCIEYLNKKKKRRDKNNIPIQEWEKHYMELLEGEQGTVWEEGERTRQ
ncbi:hypothetical protein FQR65_LT15131 [Abscondita terminalis]|nr:hypothetical protein FQR65_LT15131 [Abscondita terminalis]